MVGVNNSLGPLGMILFELKSKNIAWPLNEIYLKLVINYLVDNCCLSLGIIFKINSSFKQKNMIYERFKYF